jgi:hypothetical protein
MYDILLFNERSGLYTSMFMDVCERVCVFVNVQLSSIKNTVRGKNFQEIPYEGHTRGNYFLSTSELTNFVEQSFS